MASRAILLVRGGEATAVLPLGRPSISHRIAPLRAPRHCRNICQPIEIGQKAKGEMSELEPTPELPDDTPIREVGFPTRTKNALFAAGLKTVGEVREMSDEALLSLPNFGKASVAHLRETLGLPSADGVRPSGKKPG
jgi:DNA-directed RNA polymerase alpha subunit